MKCQAHTPACALFSSTVRCHLRLAFLIAFLTPLAPADAYAVECPTYPYPDKVATVVFAGEVAEIEGPDSSGAILVSFRVLEMRQGRHSSFITIQVQDSECDPGATSFKVGDRYLMAGFELVAAASASSETKLELARRPRYFNHVSSLRQPLPVTPNKSLERTRED
jgi:hypothetical protein